MSRQTPDLGMERWYQISTASLESLGSFISTANQGSSEPSGRQHQGSRGPQQSGREPPSLPATAPLSFSACFCSVAEAACLLLVIKDDH